MKAGNSLKMMLLLLRTVVFFLFSIAFSSTSESLNLLIVGESGVGKSYLANSLLGTDLCEEGSCGPVTEGVSEQRVLVGEQPVTVIDTEGFGVTGSSYFENIRGILTSITTTPIHLVLIAADLRTSRRLYQSFTAILDSLQAAFGSQIWSRSVFVFTNGNDHRSFASDLGATDAAAAATTAASAQMAQIRQYLVTKHGLPGPEVPGMVVAGSKEDPAWQLQLWDTILSRSKNADSAALSEVFWTQLIRRDEQMKALLAKAASVQTIVADAEKESTFLESLVAETEEAAAFRASLTSSIEAEFARLKTEHAQAMHAAARAQQVWRDAQDQGFQSLTRSMHSGNELMQLVTESRRRMQVAKEDAELANSRVPKLDIFAVAVQKLAFVMQPLLGAGAGRAGESSSWHPISTGPRPGQGHGQGVAYGVDQDKGVSPGQSLSLGLGVSAGDAKAGQKPSLRIPGHSSGRTPQDASPGLGMADLFPLRPRAGEEYESVTRSIYEATKDSVEKAAAREAGRQRARNSHCRKAFDLSGLICAFAPMKNLKKCYDNSLETFLACEAVEEEEMRAASLGPFVVRSTDK